MKLLASHNDMHLISSKAPYIYIDIHIDITKMDF